jgi:hypothetical protein
MFNSIFASEPEGALQQDFPLEDVPTDELDEPQEDQLGERSGGWLSGRLSNRLNDWLNDPLSDLSSDPLSSSFVDPSEDRYPADNSLMALDPLDDGGPLPDPVALRSLRWLRRNVSSLRVTVSLQRGAPAQPAARHRRNEPPEADQKHPFHS